MRLCRCRPARRRFLPAPNPGQPCGNDGGPVQLHRRICGYQQCAGRQDLGHSHLGHHGAQSFVTAFESETDAFQAYADLFPDSAVFLIDTYDTLREPGLPPTWANE
jgi:hypothetical protein